MKGLKAILVKYLALVISVCYLANPLQSQIGVVFHEISHLLEAPNIVLEHSKVSHTAQNAHRYHEYAHVDSTHDHQFIDLLNSIFNNSSDEDGQDPSVLTNIKVDKHLTTNDYPLKKSIYPHKRLPYLSSKSNLLKGHKKAFEEPPQISPVDL